MVPFIRQRENFHLTQEVKEKFTGKLGAEPRDLMGRKVTEVVRTDGLKLVFADGSWVCYRLSGTEPVVRVYSEARSRAGSGKIERGRQAMDFRIEQLPKIRVMPHARRGLSALVDRAPQAEAFGERIGRE